MTRKEKLYLAGAFFTPKDRSTISFLADKLRKQGFEVYVPMEHPIENAWDLTNKEWGEQVFVEDTAAILHCDCVVAVITNGMNDDSGTVWEIGYARGIGKNVYVIHNYDITKSVASLMIWNSATLNLDMDTIIDNTNGAWILLDGDTVEIEQK